MATINAASGHTFVLQNEPAIAATIVQDIKKEMSAIVKKQTKKRRWSLNAVDKRVSSLKQLEL